MKINKEIVATVLATHISILLLMWGGLSTLGVAFALFLPLIGGISYFSFQKGKQYRTNTKKAISGEFVCNQYLPFRG